jgi:hypothetical protein
MADYPDLDPDHRAIAERRLINLVRASTRHIALPHIRMELLDAADAVEQLMTEKAART